jgi:hypothetical protein
LFMDSLVEESVELVGATLLAVGALVLVKELVLKDTPGSAANSDVDHIRTSR